MVSQFESLQQQYAQFLLLNACDPTLVPFQLYPGVSSFSPLVSLETCAIDRNKLGRSYNPGRPLGMLERRRILDLYERGHKISHIARIIGVTHSCVSKIMTRYRRTGSMCPRSVRPPPDSTSENSDSSSEYSSSSSSVEDSTSSTLPEKDEDPLKMASVSQPDSTNSDEVPKEECKRIHYSPYSIEWLLS